MGFFDWFIDRETERKVEKLMVDMTALKTAVDKLQTETAAALDRVAADVAELKRRVPDEVALQADIDAIQAKITLISGNLKAVDPLPDFPPAA